MVKEGEMTRQALHHVQLYGKFPESDGGDRRVHQKGRVTLKC